VVGSEPHGPPPVNYAYAKDMQMSMHVLQDRLPLKNLEYGTKCGICFDAWLFIWPLIVLVFYKHFNTIFFLCKLVTCDTFLDATTT
jgi:hypothetical protein